MSLVILVVTNVLYYAQIGLDSQNGTTLPQVVFKPALEVSFAVSRRVFIFAGSVPLPSFNLPFELISIVKANQTFLCVHLIV
jgi:hypothetical protein